jgi:hypothetical protein
MMVLSITSIEAVAQDCDASHSPSVSALAGFENSAKPIAGISISHLLLIAKKIHIQYKSRRVRSWI